jgi:hypothetical protein
VKCWPLTVMNIKKRKNGRRREEEGRLTAICLRSVS